MGPKTMTVDAILEKGFFTIRTSRCEEIIDQLMATPEFPEGASLMLDPDNILGGASLTAALDDLPKITALLRAKGLTVIEVKECRTGQ